MSALTPYIDVNAICLLPSETSQEDAFTVLTEKLASLGVAKEAHTLIQAVHEREAVMSTGIGEGVAIPHGRLPEATRTAMAIGISREGITYPGAMDDAPVHVIFMFAMPPGSQMEYLRLLASVMMAARQEGLREALIACATPEEAIKVLTEY